MAFYKPLNIKSALVFVRAVFRLAQLRADRKPRHMTVLLVWKAKFRRKHHLRWSPECKQKANFWIRSRVSFVFRDKLLQLRSGRLHPAFLLTQRLIRVHPNRCPPYLFATVKTIFQNLHGRNFDFAVCFDFQPALATKPKKILTHGKITRVCVLTQLSPIRLENFQLWNDNRTRKFDWFIISLHSDCE